MKKIYLLAMSLLVSLSLATPLQAAQDEVIFPKINSAWVSKGTFPNVASLSQVNIDMTPAQVRNLIGTPHFNEGFILGSWNYIFHFRKSTGEVVTCQYQVRFTNRRTSGLFWNMPECDAYARVKPVLENRTYPLTIGSDGLFAFGRSDLESLLPPGRQRLMEMASQIKTGFNHLTAIKIVGHTDHIGDEASNQRLSVARAETVKQYLVAQGVETKVIKASGMGEHQPLVTCADVLGSAMIRCLQPNRRIEITVNGEQ